MRGQSGIPSRLYRRVENEIRELTIIAWDSRYEMRDRRVQADPELLGMERGKYCLAREQAANLRNALRGAA